MEKWRQELLESINEFEKFATTKKDRSEVELLRAKAHAMFQKTQKYLDNLQEETVTPSALRAEARAKARQYLEEKKVKINALLAKAQKYLEEVKIETRLAKRQDIYDVARQLIKEEKAKQERFLCDARQLVLDVMPDPIKKVLTSYHDKKYMDDSAARREWEYYVVDEILSLASVEVANTSPDGWHNEFRDTAYCPLCQNGCQTVYSRGFLYPEGLRRHLTGWGTQTLQCRIIETADQLAHDTWTKVELARSPGLSEREAEDLVRFGMTQEERNKLTEKHGLTSSLDEQRGLELARKLGTTKR